ncbi:MAG: restriction endonuclease subunit S [Tissierellia bacterium]|nr:restriction endonuclease subunit S [Tissierellia bacterium]
MRFSGYNDLWTKTTLNTVVERITRRNTNNESNLPLTISAQYGLINQNEFFNKQIASRDLTNYILLNRGEFAYNKSYSSDYPWGAVKRLDKYDKGVLSSLYICFAPKSNVDSDFLVHYFETPKWYNEISNIAGEGARNHGLLNMAVSDYFNTKHSFPSIQEQHKISQFLNLINQRIDTQSKIIEDLELFKKGIENQYFSCNKNNEYVILGDVITQINNRNEQNIDFEVLSVSNKYGFIPQSEQFDDHEVASANKSNYKIVKQNDFAYNPARINVGSIAMLRNNQVGIVSPMYICFRANNNRILSSYLDYFSHSNKFNNEVLKNLEGSVRLCLSFESLSKIRIHLHHRYSI